MKEEMSKARMWDERYAAEGFLFGTAPAAFLSKHAQRLSPGARTLVVGDGEGRNSVFLAEAGLEVTSMDISEVAVAKAQGLAAERGVEVAFSVADVLAWSWTPNAYDLVVAVFIQFLLPKQRDVVFEGLSATLRSRGTLMLHGYRPEHLELGGVGGPPLAECMYTESMLRAAFPELEVDVLESYDADLREGAGHTGTSALIDFIAHKPGPGAS